MWGEEHGLWLSSLGQSQGSARGSRVVLGNCVYGMGVKGVGGELPTQSGCSRAGKLRPHRTGEFAGGQMVTPRARLPGLSVTAGSSWAMGFLRQ